MKTFVLMPFSKEFDDIYKLGIKETAKILGVKAYRLDEELFDQGMLEKIYSEINSCDFIIADLSVKNPNVFYELGYAHALNKLCILITKNVDFIPFDLKHRRHIVYGDSIAHLKEELGTNIKWAIDEVTNNKNNPFEIEFKTNGSLNTTDQYAEADVEFTIDIENKSNKISPEIHSIYVHLSNDWAVKQDGRKVPFKKSDMKPFSFRYQIHPTMSKIPKKGWSQIKLNASRVLAYAWAGDEIKDRYHLMGEMKIELITELEIFSKTFPISIYVDVYPF